MKKPQHNCNVPDCPNYQRYSRNCGHVEDVETVEETRMQKYLKGKPAFLKEHPVCEFPGCTKPSKDVHHTQGRQGDLLSDFSKCKALCRSHHIRVHSHPVEAANLGLIVSRHSKTKTA